MERKFKRERMFFSGNMADTMVGWKKRPQGRYETGRRRWQDNGAGVSLRTES
jgi:hypothetical protein